MITSLLLTGALALVAALPQTSQNPTGLEPGDRRIANLRSDLGRCIIQRSPERVSRFLQTGGVDAWSNDPEFAPGRVTERLGIDYCMNREAVGSTYRWRPASLRAMLQEALYLGRFTGLPPASEPVVAPRTVNAPNGDNRSAMLAEFTDCVVENDLAHADALLRTGFGSPDERAVARALVPTLSTCVPKGQTIKFTPQSVRVFVAEGLWHRYFGAPTPTGN